MQEMITARLPQLRALCREYPVRRLALFGSARRDDFDAASSDLDFIVEFAPLSAAEHRRAYFGLLAALDGLFTQPIDLIEWSTIENPYLRQGIQQSQETLYVAACSPHVFGCVGAFTTRCGGYPPPWYPWQPLAR